MTSHPRRRKTCVNGNCCDCASMCHDIAHLIDRAIEEPGALRADAADPGEELYTTPADD